MDKPKCIDCVTEGSPEPNAARRRDRCDRHYSLALATGVIARVKRANGVPPAECDLDDCTRPVKANGLCASHNARAYRGADLGAPFRGAVAEKCSFPGCEKPGARGDLCAGHYQQRKDGRDLTPLRDYVRRDGECDIEGCDRPVENGGLCRSHYERRRQGRDDWDAPIRAKAPDGDGHLDEHGYRWVTTPDGRKIGEHRWVMEQHLGRQLTADETVHHRTGGFKGRSNNALSNLELWSGRHPYGHRVEDIVTYCREMLAVYGQPDEQGRYGGLAERVLTDTAA